MISLNKLSSVFRSSSVNNLLITRNYETMVVKTIAPHVRSVELNRPEKRNAMNPDFFREARECFQALDKESECRAVILSGNGKLFSAGLDLSESNFLTDVAMKDAEISRKAKELYPIILACQDAFSALEKCSKPIIAAVHNASIGAGVNLISAADIRYSTSDAWFQIKEPVFGFASDLGVLQRLPKIIGSYSLVCELAYSARKMYADEAKQAGFVSQVFPDKASMMEAALELASSIAALSPVAVQGTKANLVYSRDHTVDESLEYMARWNSTAFQSEDFVKSFRALMNKTKPEFND